MTEVEGDVRARVRQLLAAQDPHGDRKEFLRARFDAGLAWVQFNEVFLTDVRVPDAHRLGAVGDGWRVAQITLMNERVAIGGGVAPRESGVIAAVVDAWRSRPELRTPAAHDELMRLWVEAEVTRLTGMRLRQQLAAGDPGPEGSAAKLAYARLNQEVTGFELDLLGTAARHRARLAPLVGLPGPAAPPEKAGEGA